MSRSKYGTTDTSARLMILALVLMMASVLLAGCDKAVNPPSPDITLESDDDPGDKPVDLDNSHTKQETRAIWSWVGRKAMPGRGGEISKLDIDELVAQVDSAHLNVILLHVYHEGTAFFEPSRTRFPNSAERLTNQSAFASKEYPDALSYLLALRDERRADDDPFNDFQVHAWISVHRGGDHGNENPPADETEPYMLNALFPEFKLKLYPYYSKGDERYVKHGVSVIHQPKFRAYIVDLIAGLVEDYEVDGVHLDYIRTGGICFNDDYLDYPGIEYDYPGCQQDYRAWTQETFGHEYNLLGDTVGGREIEYEARGRVTAWLEGVVSLLVKSIHDEVKAANPDVIISVASVRNDTSRTSKGQMTDGQTAWEWLNQGWIDVVFVTAYSADTQAVVDKIQRVRDAVQDEERRSKIFPGLATHNSDDKESRSHLLVEQVNAVIRGQWAEQPLEPPAKGMGLFRGGRLSEQAIQLLAQGPFKEPALPFWGK